MRFVTLTDHNTIEGCLEIAHLEGAFTSAEITSVFPADGCKVHLLVWGIDEEHFAQIDLLRADIFELQRYLSSEGIAHAVAHPFYSVDQKLNVRHVEQLLLLFKHFERLNGLRDARYGDAFGALVESLTPERMAAMSERHGIQASHPEPWVKIFTGGSDDHGGVFPGAAWTEFPRGPVSPEQLLEHIREGFCGPAGRGGEPLVLAHGLYNTVYRFAKSKFARNVHGATELVERAVSRFLEGKNPTEFTFSEKLAFLTEGIVSGRVFELANPANAPIWRELADYFNRPDLKSALERQTAGVLAPERRAFIMANHIANELAFRYFNRALEHIQAGRLLEGLQSITTIAPIGASLAPYIYALQSQSASRRRLRGLLEAAAGIVPADLRNMRRAWLTDTLEDVNGVATTIKKMTAAAVANGRDITVVTSRARLQIEGIPIRNFPPVGEFELPEYELQKLSFPPVLAMLDYLQQGGFGELIVSTPGPVGLIGLAAAKLFGLRVSGIYHTDFPQYVRILSDDSFLETLTWNYMHRFYSEMDVVFVNSDHYRKLWAARGIPEEKLVILPRGLDTELFHPRRRDPSFWTRYGGKSGAITLAYVGRISKEKDLDVLARAWPELSATGVADGDVVQPIQLAFVGDGPYLEELRRPLPDAVFTGYLEGEELAAAYASADVFVFPSTTDTFGNVLLEAMASGLPAVVSDVGGPCELVHEGETGFVTPALDVPAFSQAVVRLVRDPDLRERMSRNAHRRVQERSWRSAAERFWTASPEI